MLERRRLPRNRVHLGASIVFNQKYSTSDCVVHNLSTDGAKLCLGDTLCVPDVFDLTIRQQSKTYVGKIIWRSRDHLGLKFLDPDLGVEPIRLDLARRLRASGAERAKLRERVARSSEPS